MVDKKPFPRPKVCGACLSGHALGVLRQVGLGKVPAELGGRPYDRFRLWTKGSHANVCLPEGMAVTRGVMDSRLAAIAMADGVTFLAGTQAELVGAANDARQVRLRQPDGEVTVAATMVIAADGITGNLLENEPGAVYRTWRNSRIGAGGVVYDDQGNYQEGAIYMGVGRHGYAGLVRVENGGLNVGAALDMRFVRRQGGIGPAIESILEESGLPISAALRDASWRGTSPMTRRASQAGGHRLLAIGDATGYAEPFTGEGMAWAMTSAVMVVPHALQAVREWRPEIAVNWTTAHRRALRARQNACFRLATLLRFPHLVHGAVVLLSCFPSLASPVVRRLNSIPREIYR
jgi:flavin-dependent dehydrogenase